MCHSAYSAALRRVDAATCSHPGACTVCVDVAGRSCESMAYTVPPQNTPPGGRPGDFVAADVNAEARRPKRACGLRGLPEVRSPRSDDCQLGRLAARSCREDSPESSSESCSESDRQSDMEDYGRSCFEGDGDCASARDGQRNRDGNGQNSGQSHAGHCVLSSRGNP